jgi:protein TonB
MNRYLSSFFITTLFYSILGISFLYLLSNKTASAKEMPQEKMQKISFSIIEPLKEEVKEIKQEVKKVKQQEKVTPKPIVNQKPQLKKKQIVKKTPKQELKPKTKEPTKPKEIKQEPTQIAKTLKSQSEKQTPQKIVDTKKIEAKQNAFMVKLRELIDANKSYPKSARRRGIEGNVDVRFNILANGCVKNISIVSGKKIFKKSAINAIERSFPVVVDATLFSFPKEFRVTLVYKLKA